MRWNSDTYKATWIDVVGVLHGWVDTSIPPLSSLKNRAKVLECGVGSGKWSAAFALLGFNVTAMDNSIDMLSRVRTNFPNIKIRLHYHDVRDYPIVEDNSIDLLFSEGLIEHFLDEKERKTVLGNFYKAVQKSGYITVIVPFNSTEEDEISYSDAMLKEELEDAGFSILNIRHHSFLSRDGVTKRELVEVKGQKNESNIPHEFGR